MESRRSVRRGVGILLLALWLNGGAGPAMAQAPEGEKSEPKPTEEKALRPVEVVAPPIREQAERAETGDDHHFRTG